jgi:hypothetical protein
MMKQENFTIFGPCCPNLNSPAILQVDKIWSFHGTPLRPALCLKAQFGPQATRSVYEDYHMHVHIRRTISYKPIGWCALRGVFEQPSGDHTFLMLWAISSNYSPVNYYSLLEKFQKHIRLRDQRQSLPIVSICAILRL